LLLLPASRLKHRTNRQGWKRTASECQVATEFINMFCYLRPGGSSRQADSHASEWRNGGDGEGNGLWEIGFGVGLGLSPTPRGQSGRHHHSYHRHSRRGLVIAEGRGRCNLQSINQSINSYARTHARHRVYLLISKSLQDPRVLQQP